MEDVNLAWTIGFAAEEVGTAEYIVNVMVGGGVPGSFLPLIIFIAAMFIAFTTGTSWGTMGILTPLAVPLGYELVGIEILPVLMGVLFGGAIWGDHCSPISDTTVMSSIFAGADHIDHVNTQIPFAMTAAGVTVIVLLLYAIGLQQVFIALPLAFILTTVAVLGLNKLDARRKNLPEVMPTREEIKSSELHRESIDHQGSETNGNYDLLDTVPLVALTVVIAYFALVFVFATLGG